MRLTGLNGVYDLFVAPPNRVKAPMGVMHVALEHIIDSLPDINADEPLEYCLVALNDPFPKGASLPICFPPTMDCTPCGYSLIAARSRLSVIGGNVATAPDVQSIGTFSVDNKYSFLNSVFNAYARSGMNHYFVKHRSGADPSLVRVDPLLNKKISEEPYVIAGIEELGDIFGESWKHTILERILNLYER